ncbi:MAG: FAD-binding oxidoreductase [Salinivirgaceae bacterium]|jgi:ferredoxin--NADP+ reductase|nr:FAD-binding oxidoreductase [Salinivirgaceae bacterium]
MYHNIHKIEKISHLNDSTFILQIERRDLKFTPGQHLVVGKKDDKEFRQYSLYNGINDDYFQILVKEVENGLVTPKLKNLKEGDEVEINGPMGYFTLSESTRKNLPVVMIATGTGIAPFKSFVVSYPELDYKLIHGVRTAEEAYDKELYAKDKYILCTTRDDKGTVKGRVTDYISTKTFHKDTQFYLCGNSEMIFDAMEILKEKGFSANQMFAEVYF